MFAVRHTKLRTNILLAAFQPAASFSRSTALFFHSIKFDLFLSMRIKEMHCSTSHTEFAVNIVVAVFVPIVSFLCFVFFFVSAASAGNVVKCNKNAATHSRRYLPRPTMFYLLTSDRTSNPPPTRVFYMAFLRRFIEPLMHAAYCCVIYFCFVSLTLHIDPSAMRQSVWKRMKWMERREK